MNVGLGLVPPAIDDSIRQICSQELKETSVSRV